MSKLPQVTLLDSKLANIIYETTLQPCVSMSGVKYK